MATPSARILHHCAVLFKLILGWEWQRNLHGSDPPPNFWTVWNCSNCSMRCMLWWRLWIRLGSFRICFNTCDTYQGNHGLTTQWSGATWFRDSSYAKFHRWMAQIHPSVLSCSSRIADAICPWRWIWKIQFGNRSFEPARCFEIDGKWSRMCYVTFNQMKIIFFFFSLLTSAARSKSFALSQRRPGLRLKPRP